MRFQRRNPESELLLRFLRNSGKNMKRGTRAIILRDQRILLGRRLKKDSFYGQWCTFGGLFKRGETPEQALRRELREELGIDVVDPEPITVVEDVLPSVEDKLQQHFFLITKWKGVLTNKREHSEIRWLSKNELEKLPVGRIGRGVIEKHLNDRF